MTCPTCGHANPDDASFCGACGSSLAAELTCIHCGRTNRAGTRFCHGCGQPLVAIGRGGQGSGPRGHEEPQTEVPPLAGAPAAFARGRYQMVRFLGEGGKKRVYLAHDTRLDRDVAFALIKYDGLDVEGLIRIRREAQAMARLGDHPHVVTVYDIGDEDGPSTGSGGPQPYLVSQYMAGGDLEELLSTAEDHRLPLDQALQIADQVCQALEHAHKQGIVHRDVKPGNVWLAAPTPSSPPSLGEGQGKRATVKLGDFGLALSLDRSRLTQAGMMVGTVAYMAPEQAMGAEVTARSDLYSLGCMLYELVTGRPPFVGDESVAIITQHLNTPPVAPTWHRQGLPPGLEALILRLLEKDPTKRPASATEVREALRGVQGLGFGSQEPSAPGAQPLTPNPQPPTSQGGPSPIYRRTFVGRETELRELQAAFDRAVSGEGSLLTVVGEPGIGKTALCEQLATYAAMRGGKTLVGHCYEEGSLALPYLAFVEAMRTYVLGREPDGLKQDLGTGAAEVARIVSEIRDRIPQSELRTQQSPDPDEERWRLFQAVTGFLRNAASVQPLVIVLEDLHWADRGTLDLLVHVARNLSGARLLVGGTYRDVEVDRSHPLSATLAELRRAGEFRRVLLRGLTPDEVHRMINTISGQEVRWGLAEAIHRQTEGNPLFIQEVLRYLVEEGLVVREGDHWVGSWREGGGPLPELAMPEGLRDVIGKRLSRLSPECNRVLAVAAVIGRDFALETLRLLADTPSPSPLPQGGEEKVKGEEALLAALEEAQRVGVLEDISRAGLVRFRFAHAFFRQTLYEEIFTPRRLRLHQEVARALERQYASRLEEHAAELTEHFAQSSDPEDLRKAVSYAQLASRRAMAVSAYGEAARHLGQALQAQEVLDPHDQATRCDLLLALGQALGPTGEPQRVVDQVAPEAFALAEALDDQSRAARACVLALENVYRYAAGVAGRMPVARDWGERLDRCALPGTVERVHADLARYTILFNNHRWGEARALRLRAFDLAQQLGDPQALFTWAQRSIQPGFIPPRDQPKSWRLAEEFVDRPREGVSVLTLHGLLASCAGAFLEAGERGRAEAIWRELDQLASRTQDPVVLLGSRGREILLATLDGDLDAALEKANRLVERASDVGSRVAGLQEVGHLTYWPLLYLGRAEEAITRISGARLEAGLGPRGGMRWGRAPYCLALMGRPEEAEQELRQALHDYRIAEDEDVFSTVLADLLPAAVLLKDREATELLAGRLAGVTAVAWGGSMLTNVARFLGAAALLLGDRAAARENYERALDWATKIRHRPEIALTRLELAELLLDELRVAGSGFRVQTEAAEPATRNPEPETRREAAAHLDFAIAELRAMKMQPALERALACKKGSGGPDVDSAGG